ncbi:MAG: TetR/AcrR family transcriptional regulator [Desulfatibacillaceae bacterium]
MMTYQEFKNLVNLSKREICKEIFSENAESIKVKKEERVVKNLAKIFDATLALSNKKGFHAMSLRDLSKASGLSMGALYSYFASKDELLNMIQEQGRRVTMRTLAGQVDAAEGSRDRLRAAIMAHLYLSEAMQPWFYFSYMEAKNLARKQQKEAIQNELATEGFLADLLREGRKEGVFSDRDPVMTSAVIKAMLQDWYLKRWKYNSRSIDVETYARFVIEWVESFIAVG